MERIEAEVKRETTLICGSHEYYQVPLIWTFAFPGWEYWCPYCGGGGGMLGTGTRVQNTPELETRLNRYTDASKDFLKYNALLCCEKTKWNDEWISPENLPQEEKDRLSAANESHKYGVKAEEHDGTD